MRQLMIAGVTSGVGKTTLTLGIIQALKNRSLTVQPYKVGPDYIDTGFHSRISGRQSINLDEFLVPEVETLQGLYQRSLVSSDIALVEGVMGLFDGKGSDAFACSSAGIAELLDLPVILVIDGKATSTSAAAIVKGYAEFDPRIRIAGVIVNRVGSASHYELIKSAIERYTNVKVIGYMLNNPNYAMPSRHLGLIPETEREGVVEMIEQLAEDLKETIDFDLLWALGQTVNLDSADILTSFTKKLAPYTQLGDYSDLTIGIAKDQAFSFYYQDNINLLEELGVKLISFSPLKDAELPLADALYFGGGFPELFASQLEANSSMRQAVYRAHSQKFPILAECGGMMYLGEVFNDQEESYQMAGIIPGASYMTDRLRRFGYCSLKIESDCSLGQIGDTLNGHEFHHSEFLSDLPTVGRMVKTRDGQITQEWPAGFQIGNTFASYLHIHFYQNPTIIKRWLDMIRKNKLNYSLPSEQKTK